MSLINPALETQKCALIVLQCELTQPKPIDAQYELISTKPKEKVLLIQSQF